MGKRDEEDREERYVRTDIGVMIDEFFLFAAYFVLGLFWFGIIGKETFSKIEAMMASAFGNNVWALGAILELALMLALGWLTVKAIMYVLSSISIARDLLVNAWNTLTDTRTGKIVTAAVIAVLTLGAFGLYAWVTKNDQLFAYFIWAVCVAGGAVCLGLITFAINVIQKRASDVSAWYDNRQSSLGRRELTTFEFLFVALFVGVLAGLWLIGPMVWEQINFGNVVVESAVFLLAVAVSALAIFYILRFIFKRQNSKAP
jgi:hypothetical protein